MPLGTTDLRHCGPTRQAAHTPRGPLSLAGKVPYPSRQLVLLLLPALYTILQPYGPGAAIGEAAGVPAGEVAVKAVWCFVAIAAAQYAHYIAVVTNQLARRLGIYVFSLGPRR